MAINQDLVDHRGFTHGYNSVKWFCRPLRELEPAQFDVLEIKQSLKFDDADKSMPDGKSSDWLD